MNDLIFAKPSEVPNPPKEAPGKNDVPQQPEVYPPGDKPINPTDPGKQPIALPY